MEKKLMMKKIEKNSTYDMKLPSFLLQIRRSRMLGKRDKIYILLVNFTNFLTAKCFSRSYEFISCFKKGNINYLAECKTWTWIIARACNRVDSTANFAWGLLDWLMTCSSCFRRILKYGLNDTVFNTIYV